MVDPDRAAVSEEGMSTIGLKFRIGATFICLLLTTVAYFFALLLATIKVPYLRDDLSIEFYLSYWKGAAILGTIASVTTCLVIDVKNDFKWKFYISLIFWPLIVFLGSLLFFTMFFGF